MATPNMTLTLPSPNVTPGPTWATQLNTALEAVDQHDHSSSKGVKITPAGFNWNADLAAGNNKVTGLKGAVFQLQGSTSSTAGEIHNHNGDLYWVSSGGTAVQITSGTGINIASTGTIGGDYGAPGVTASATYSDSLKVFSWLQSSGVPAKMYCGDIQLTYPGASENSITLKAQTGSAAYSFSFPAVAPTANNMVMATSTVGVAVFKQILGTTAQVTVTQNAADMTISLPAAVSIGTSITVPTVSAITVTASGAVSGATAVFSSSTSAGALSATTGTFSGALSATTGTFSGATSATTVSASGAFVNSTTSGASTPGAAGTTTTADRLIMYRATTTAEVKHGVLNGNQGFSAAGGSGVSGGSAQLWSWWSAAGGTSYSQVAYLSHNGALATVGAISGSSIAAGTAVFSTSTSAGALSATTGVFSSSLQSTTLVTTTGGVRSGGVLELMPVSTEGGEARWYDSDGTTNWLVDALGTSGSNYLRFYNTGSAKSALQLLTTGGVIIGPTIGSGTTDLTHEIKGDGKCIVNVQGSSATSSNAEVHLSASGVTGKVLTIGTASSYGYDLGKTALTNDGAGVLLDAYGSSGQIAFRTYNTQRALITNAGMAVTGTLSTTGELTVGSGSASGKASLKSVDSGVYASQLAFLTGTSQRWIFISGQSYAGYGAADSMSLVCYSTNRTVHNVTNAGAHTFSNSTDRGSHTVNGYMSVNGAGTSGSASGQHPYLATMVLTGTTVSGGTAQVPHGLGSKAKIKNVMGKLTSASFHLAFWSHAAANPIETYWDDTYIYIKNGSDPLASYGIELLVTYAP